MTRILRVDKQKDFTTIDNRYVRDKRLSWQAKGLLVYIFTLPDDWKIYPDELRKHATTGISGTRSALKELRTHGYLELKRIVDQKGKVVSWEYLIHEVPILPRNNSDCALEHTKKPELENPHVEKPQVDHPHVENRTLLNTNLNELLIQRNTECTPEVKKNAYAKEMQLYIRSKMIACGMIKDIDMKWYTNISDLIDNLDVLNKERIDKFFKEKKTIKKDFINEDLKAYAANKRRLGETLEAFSPKPEYQGAAHIPDYNVETQGREMIDRITKRIKISRGEIA